MLLGMKKRGFGMGRWNGFGGKVSTGETVEEAAVRELGEEVGIIPTDFKKAGILEFSFESEKDTLEVHIYRVNHFEGTPEETEEMKPAWFSVGDIPLKQMWSDDEFWFPYLLSGSLFKGSFHFDKPADREHSAVILKQELHQVDSLE